MITGITNKNIKDCKKNALKISNRSQILEYDDTFNLIVKEILRIPPTGIGGTHPPPPPAATLPRHMELKYDASSLVNVMWGLGLRFSKLIFLSK